MPKSKEQKKEILDDLAKKIKEAKSVIIADYSGLKVVDSEELRNKCKEENVEFLAVKKTILKKVLLDAGFENCDSLDYSGSLALAFGNEDEVAPAKILKNFIKNHEKVQFKSGILEGKVIDINKVEFLAALPSKPELYAKIVGSINAPISGFVNVLAGNLRGLVNVLNAIKGIREA